MTRSTASSFGIVLTSGLLALVSPGCAGDGEVRDAEADGLDGVAAHGDELTESYWRSRHHVVHRHDAGAETGGTGNAQPDAGAEPGGSITGGTGGGADLNDCAVCTRANDCCNAVDAGALCTFSAATCVSLEPAAREAYVNNCKVLINTVASVRTSRPSSCE